MSPAKDEPDNLCRANAWTWNVNAVCETCHHAGAVHPGPNDVDACILCRLDAAIVNVMRYLP